MSIGQVEELETSLDLPLQLVYMKQLALLREKALQRYKTLAKGSETSDYQVNTTPVIANLGLRIGALQSSVDDMSQTNPSSTIPPARSSL